ncbi:MAG: hypothetical protein GX786_04410 [Clostridiales bacterium]|nr:hypothetical protein [Clostridiales bacterium]
MTNKKGIAFFALFWSVLLFLTFFIGLLVFFATNATIMSFLFNKCSSPSIHGISPQQYPWLAKTITGFLSGNAVSSD